MEVTIKFLVDPCIQDQVERKLNEQMNDDVIIEFDVKEVMDCEYPSIEFVITIPVGEYGYQDVANYSGQFACECYRFMQQ